MDIKQDFSALDQWHGLDQDQVAVLAGLATIVQCEANTVICSQHYPANNLYLLYEGTIEFSITAEKDKGFIPLGFADEQWTAAGWSGFREQKRYATNITAETDCQLLQWSQDDLSKLFKQYPQLGERFLSLIRLTSSRLLNQARENIAASIGNEAQETESAMHDFDIAADINTLDLVADIRISSFFSAFDDTQLQQLLTNASVRSYAIKHSINSQEKGLFILLRGAASIQYRKDQDIAPVYIRSLRNCGQVLDWSFGASDSLVVTFRQTSLVVFIPDDAIAQLSQHSPSLAYKLMQQCLQLHSNQLRTARSQLIAQCFHDVELSIRNLLFQAAPQLAISSPLHKVPHLLQNRATQPDAFENLHIALESGDAKESNLAGLCLDLLQNTERESIFYQGLMSAYDTVARAPQDLTPKQIRNANAQAFVDAFSALDVRIQGLENLPESSGHIFILNHLISHPYNTLPNGFELALDTHLVSSLLLYQKYNDAGIRVVRKPRRGEFGHQNYYDRLGCIYVVTNESDELDIKDKSTDRFVDFLESTRDCIQQGNNLVICPEGTSRWSDQSPGVFKAGAFIVAGSIEPEPLIVPIAVANIDKKLNTHNIGVVIKQPFKISEHVDVKDREAMESFLVNYQKIYRQYVLEATDLAQG